MKVGLKPKKFFHDIVLVSRSEMERIRFEIEKRKEKKLPQRKRLVLDTVFPEDYIKKGISSLWQKEKVKKIVPKAPPQNRIRSLEEVAERVLTKKEVSAVPRTSIRPKTFLKNYLILFLELTIISLMVYNAVSLYFDKSWLIEKLNNLSIASKAHIASASESLSNFDRDKGSDELTKAGINLMQIKAELLNQGEYNYILPGHPMLNNELTLGQNMLELGLLIKDSNNDLNTAIDNLTNNQSSEENLWQKAESLKAIVARIEGRVNRADVILKNNPDIKKALGPDNGPKVANIIDKSKVELNKINKVLEVFPLILGKNGDNHYLIFFLNNAEMRAGGGFPGNYGLLNFTDNKIDKIKIDNIYNLDRLKWGEITKINDAALNGSDAIKQLGLESLAYPEPVERNAKKMDISRYWQMSYSNWNIDFRDNVRRAEYLYNNFYQQGQVSGAIAITPDLIENTLAVIGPIGMDEYGVEVNKDNFRDVIEYKVEVDNLYKTEGRKDINPKQILTDFGPKFLDKISTADLGQKIKILEILLDSVKSKQILLYHNDPKVESVISELGASGEIKSTEGDSLGIFQTNANGMKNGRMIDNRASLKSNVSFLGFALDELSLTIVNNEPNPRFLHGPEVSYYEIMVPSGSRIREAKLEGKDFIGEIDYFEEAGHTILGFRIGLDPGEAKNIIIKYQAPISGYPDNGYSLNVIKQVGAKPIEFKTEINFENSGSAQNPIYTSQAINTDLIIK